MKQIEEYHQILKDPYGCVGIFKAESGKEDGRQTAPDAVRGVYRTAQEEAESIKSECRG